MKMASKSRTQAGAVKPEALLMLTSFLVVAGFLYWLSARAVPTEVAVPEPEDEPMTGEVAMTEFSVATASYVGQEIALRGISVATLLGAHAFWTNLDDAQKTPYLVHLSDALLADSATVVAGTTVDVVGTVLAMSDSILDAWEAAGAFTNGETDRFQAEFAETFLEISSVADAELAEPAGEPSAEPSS